MIKWVSFTAENVAAHSKPMTWPQAFRELDSDGSGEIEQLVLHVSSLMPKFVLPMILLDKCRQCIYIYIYIIYIYINTPYFQDSDPDLL